MSMKYVDEYRDPDLARRIASEIGKLSAGQPLKLMEVCGGHTHTIYKHGIEDVLPRNIDLIHGPGCPVDLIHGPGCPVCVLPMGRIDDAIAIARMDGVIFTTFGDMMRVPGSKGSLLDAKADGADVRFVYSPLDAYKLARQHPDRQVVFFAIGFETTAPSTAVTLLRAKAEGTRNFSVFCNHVTIIPAMKAILDSPDLRLDGFIGAGHVSMVIGMRPYNFVARQHHKPVVIARTMELRPFFEWRGLGFITHSALKLRPEFADWDAELRYEVPGLRVADPKACQCGEVLKGVIKPWECKVFGTACTPETPIGTCMVSPEGACAAYYSYGRFSMASERSRLNILPMTNVKS